MGLGSVLSEGKALVVDSEMDSVVAVQQMPHHQPLVSRAEEQVVVRVCLFRNCPYVVGSDPLPQEGEGEAGALSSSSPPPLQP